MKSVSVGFIVGFRGTVAKSQGERNCEQTTHKSANASVAEPPRIDYSAHPTMDSNFPNTTQLPSHP
jgi:hypothetical protein